MNAPQAPASSRPSLRWLPPTLLSLTAVVLYAGSLDGPFVFDDLDAIVRNESLTRLATALQAPAHGETVSGRPLLNLSFALNHAAGGLAPFGYHLVNVVIHALTGLVLYGLVRRTLLRPSLAARFAGRADGLAFAAALLWLAHPLATAAVTYVAQRAECLATLCQLLALYAFVRSEDSARSRGWLALSVLACWLGVGVKETAATTPLLVLLYDRTFAAGSVRSAGRARRDYYGALAASWLLLGALVVSADGRGGTAGLQSGLSPWSYALTQCEAVLHYLRLAFWPHPLVFDYGTPQASGLAAIWPSVILLGLLLAGTLALLIRRRMLGFLPAAFFLLLAPSSSVIPVATQTIAEHRMYLPLAAVVTLAVIGLHAATGRATVPVALGLAVGLGAATVRRNQDYQSAEGLWRDTVAKCPHNARAHVNLGNLLLAAGQPEGALAAYRDALALEPGDPAARDNCGIALMMLGRPEEARAELEATLALAPDNADAHYNLGNALAATGDMAGAVSQYRAALQRQPDLIAAHGNLANALMRLDRLHEAIAHYAAVARLDPTSALARFQLGNALALNGRLAEALPEFDAAVRLDPADLRARAAADQVRALLANHRQP